MFVIEMGLIIITACAPLCVFVYMSAYVCMCVENGLIVCLGVAVRMCVDILFKQCL